MELVKKYFNVSDDPAVADFALVFVKSPMGGVGYEKDDREKGGSGYVPISLQYSPYTAVNAREKSIAAGDPLVDPSITDRTYKGKSFTALNHAELKSILDTRIAMADKPVIVSVEASGPMIFSEFESKVDGILLGFGVQDQAILDILTGVEPSGLLPVQMPADMKTVEEQFEDTPHDMNCHVDAQGNKYDFGFGLNWKGKISDKRTEKYKKRK